MALHGCQVVDERVHARARVTAQAVDEWMGLGLAGPLRDVLRGAGALGDSGQEGRAGTLARAVHAADAVRGRAGGVVTLGACSLDRGAAAGGWVCFPGGPWYPRHVETSW